MTHVWALWNHCICLVIITRECFRNLNWSLQLENIKLSLKGKLKQERMTKKKILQSSFIANLSYKLKKKKMLIQLKWKKMMKYHLGDSAHLWDSCLSVWNLVRSQNVAFCLFLIFFPNLHLLHFIILVSTSLLVICNMISSSMAEERKQNSAVLSQS